MIRNRITKVANVYDTLSETWDSKSHLIKEVFGGESNRGLKIIDSLTTDGMTIIDMGAGTGRATLRALKKNQDITIYSVDISKKMLQHLKNSVSSTFPNFKHLHILNADVNTVDVPEKADLITMLYLLHHVEDAKETLAHSTSLLKKNGIILVQVPGVGECAKEVPPVLNNHSKDLMGRFTLQELLNIGASVGLEPVIQYTDNFIFKFDTSKNAKEFMKENSLLARSDEYNSVYANAEKFDGVKSINGQYLTIAFKKKVSVDEDNEDNIKAYKKWSQFYSNYALDKISKRGYSYNTLAEILYAKSMKGNSYGRLLDIGCGTGLVDKKIKEQHPSISIYGADLSIDMLLKNVCQKDYEGLYLGDSVKIPFSENYFNGIISSFMVHHSHTVDALIEKMYQLLAPNGRIAIVDFVIKDPESYDKYYQSSVREYGATVNHYTIEQMIQWLEGSGFKNIDFTQLGEDRDLPHILFTANK